MKVLLMDGANLIHRARYGFIEGEHSTVFNFFRSFRSLVEQFKPEKIIFALEGYPKFRHDLYPDYKSNRKIDSDNTEKYQEYQKFKIQRDVIINLLKYFPIELIQHPDYEADDLIGKLISQVYHDDECIIITADTDYLQLLDSSKKYSGIIKIYNPIKKQWAQPLDYDYVLYKSLVGDTADFIQGVPKVGPKTADKLVRAGFDDFEIWLHQKPERKEIIERNKALIQFADVPIQEILNLHLETNLEFVKSQFEKMNFKSLLTEKAWQKFLTTFPE